MENTFPKSIPTLTALFGLKFPDVFPFTIESDSSVEICDEWFRLHVGIDVNGADFLAVFTEADSFVLSTIDAASAPGKTRKNRANWVSLVSCLQFSNLFYGDVKSVFYGNFEVFFGRDECQRELLGVQCEERGLNFLFRNPASVSVEPFNTQGVLAVHNQMTTPEVVLVSKTSEGKPIDTTGDSDLDALLNTLA
jgi:hypothetical protein